jgi:hypothetical protein
MPPVTSINDTPQTSFVDFAGDIAGPGMCS